MDKQTVMFLLSGAVAIFGFLLGVIQYYLNGRHASLVEDFKDFRHQSSEEHKEISSRLEKVREYQRECERQCETKRDKLRQELSHG